MELMIAQWWNGVKRKVCSCFGWCGKMIFKYGKKANI